MASSINLLLTPSSDTLEQEEEEQERGRERRRETRRRRRGDLPKNHGALITFSENRKTY
jgi:hypothetical protein